MPSSVTALVAISILVLAPSGRLRPSSYRQSEKAVAQRQASKTLSLPPEAGAWLVTLTKSGGYFGGKGSLVISSLGDVAAGRNYLYACTAKLSDEESNKMAQLMSAVDISALSSCAAEEQPGPGGADRKRTQIELHQRMVNGAERSYRTVWYSGEEQRVPKDLITIRDTMTIIEKRVIEDCKGYR